MAKKAGYGVGGNGIPRKTFGVGLKQTNRGTKMGTMSATLSNPARGGGIKMASTSKVKS